jgi:hypothetical protein
VRALALLADSHTLWPEPSQEKAGHIEALGEQEQVDLLDRLTPLLKAPDERLRGAAARALFAASHPADSARSGRQTMRALAALSAAYRTQPPGPTRDDLAEVVCTLGGPAHWQGVSGNPRGLCGWLRDFDRQQAQAAFWLQLRTGALTVLECPTLRLERLEPTGKVAETKDRPLSAVNLPRPWNEGWDGAALLLVEFPTGMLAPGTWRVTVTGTAGIGPDRVKWTTEPKTLVIRPPEGPTGTVRRAVPARW